MTASTAQPIIGLKHHARPDWLDDVIVMAGNWEPLAHRRRAICASVDDADHYHREHSQEMVDALVQAGVTAAVWHFFKGFGFEHEKKEMVRSRRFGQLCHRAGLKYGTYVNFGSLYSEAFFAEIPAARAWLALDAQEGVNGLGQCPQDLYRWMRGRRSSESGAGAALARKRSRARRGGGWAGC